jgi:flagellar assembly protein FliH
MSDQAPRKFVFDTEFDDAGEIAFAAVRPKRLFSADEVDVVRNAAFADGERAALGSMQALQAQALAAIAEACRMALPRLAEVAHEHRTGSAALALACGKAIAGAALERFPEAPVQAALESLAREVETAPRLLLVCAPEVAEAVQTALAETALAIGYPGHVQVRAQAGLTAAAFTLDFGDGSASFDPDAAAARVAATLHAALAAEGLHAEPLVPGGES